MRQRKELTGIQFPNDLNAFGANLFFSVTVVSKGQQIRHLLNFAVTCDLTSKAFIMP
jgi:hypothetical protein